MANKKPRTEKQLAALAAGRAKRQAAAANNVARKKGVDTTGEAGKDVDDLSDGAPNVVTTGYAPVGDSPEQIERKKKQKPDPVLETDSTGSNPTVDSGKGGTDSGSVSETPRTRSGLFGLIADGLGL